MTTTTIHTDALPQSDWGVELKGKRLRFRLFSDLQTWREAEVVGYESDYECTRIWFLHLEMDKGERLTVNPLALAEYTILGGE